MAVDISRSVIHAESETRMAPYPGHICRYGVAMEQDRQNRDKVSCQEKEAEGNRNLRALF